MYPFILRSVLTLAECEEIRHYADREIETFGKLDAGFWDGRVIQSRQIVDSAIKAKILHNRNALKAALLEYDQTITQPLYGDTLQIVRWVAGYELQPHADRENPDGSPHPFPWRDYAAITFLNNDFTGGELYFPKLDNLTITPQPGMSIIFPGDLAHLHGVKEVRSGVRYTLASFLTHDAGHADYLDV